MDDKTVKRIGNEWKKTAKKYKDDKVSNSPHSDIILWCRRYQTDTKQFTPYVCFGRLTYHSHVPQSHPLKFIWNLVDYDELKNHADAAVRERFAAFTT